VLAGVVLTAGVAAAEMPANSQAPSITGPNPPQVGSVLTGHNGSWLYSDGRSCGSECEYTFQWSRCPAGGECTVVQPDSAVRTYTVAAADAGSSIALAVTAKKWDCNALNEDCRWVTRTANAAPTATVAGTAPAAPATPSAVAVGPAELAGAVASAPYSQTLTATGGTGPYTFSVVSGALPPGLALAPSGVLSGTPADAGTFSFAVRASGSGAASGTRAYSLRVAVMMAPLALADGLTGVAYAQQLTISAGGVQPFAFRVTGGSLPPGVTLTSAGMLGGTPTRAGTYRFTVVANDARGAEGRFTYALEVGWPTLTFETEIRPAISDRPSRRRLAVSGGTAPYTWLLADGSVLPPGLRLGRDGVLRGTPSAPAGTFMFEVTVTDAYGAPGRSTLSLDLRPALLLIRPTGLRPTFVGRRYDVRLRAGGGKAPYRFSRVAGRLPRGLRLAASGRLTGEPRAAGTFRFTVRAADANGAARTRAFTLSVRA
jgi:hypothetical protein